MSTPLTDRSDLLGTLSRLYQRSYAADYIGLILIQALFLTTRFLITPFHRQFTLDDRAIQHPLAAVERVSSFQNFIYAGCIPFGVLLLYSILSRAGWHKSHVTILGFLISISLTSLLTHIVKNAIGRPRPDLIARCMPGPGTPEHDLVSFEICTNPDIAIVNYGFRSFPSGHSSFAFSGLGYLALYLAGQLHTLRPRTDLARVLISGAPLVGAMLVAMSRMADYRHDVYDVSVGSLLGLLVAWFSYRRYFRSLKDVKCHDVYPSPLSDVGARRTHVMSPPKDEEEQAVRAEDFDLEDLTEDEAETRLLEDSAATSPSGRAKSKGKHIDDGGGSGTRPR